MTRVSLSLLVVWLCAGALDAQPPVVPPRVSPASAVQAALADCQKLSPTEQVRARYLSLYNLPAKDRETWGKVLAFWSNSLSRESDFGRVRLVTPDLVHLDLGDFRWDPDTWEKLLQGPDPYFHVQVVRIKEEFEEYGYYSDYERTRWVTTRKVLKGKKEIREAAAAPWLPGKEIAALIQLTHSQAPLLRADWWLYQTALAEDRQAGYYDWLGLGKKQADFEELVGADRKRAAKLRKEVKGVVGNSSVTLNNRGLVRVPTLTEGSYWVSEDYKTSVAKQQRLRLLDNEAEPDASEQYGTLPNGLFAFWLQNGKGERQNTAPDFIASDGQSRGTDRRVHVGLSCARCHVEGIRPIADWARKVYQPPNRLDAPDEETQRRLRQEYLSDLEGKIKKDQTEYAATLKRLNGLTPAANAKAFADAWDWYAERMRSLDDLAIDLGVSTPRLRGALQAATRPGPLDPVLLGLLNGEKIRVEHLEEIYPLAQDILLRYPEKK